MQILDNMKKIGKELSYTQIKMKEMEKWVKSIRELR